MLLSIKAICSRHLIERGWNEVNSKTMARHFPINIIGCCCCHSCFCSFALSTSANEFVFTTALATDESISPQSNFNCFFSGIFFRKLFICSKRMAHIAGKSNMDARHSKCWERNLISSKPTLSWCILMQISAIISCWQTKFSAHVCRESSRIRHIRLSFKFYQRKLPFYAEQICFITNLIIKYALQCLFLRLLNSARKSLEERRNEVSLKARNQIEILISNLSLTHFDVAKLSSRN